MSSLSKNTDDRVNSYTVPVYRCRKVTKTIIEKIKSLPIPYAGDLG